MLAQGSSVGEGDFLQDCSFRNRVETHFDVNAQSKKKTSQKETRSNYEKKEARARESDGDTGTPPSRLRSQAVKSISDRIMKNSKARPGDQSTYVFVE